ncbi:MAG: alpha/beta hydrolase [Trueperaceae bacterium]
MGNLRRIMRRSVFKTISYVDPQRAAQLASRIFSTPRSRPFTEEDKCILAKGQVLSLKSGLTATVWGDKKEETVLLIHGWQRHRASLGKFIEPLVEQGRRVVAVDAPAHGDSPGKKTNPLEYAKAILTVGKELGKLDGIIAHSMGGGATLIALSQGLQAKRIVLLASAANWEYQMRFFATYLGLSERAASRLVKVLEAQAQIDVDKLDSAYVCKGLQQNALLFHDPEDLRVPYKDSVAIAEQLPHAQLVTVRGLGHGGILKDEDVIRRSVTFLKEIA